MTLSLPASASLGNPVQPAPVLAPLVCPLMPENLQFLRP